MAELEPDPNDKTELPNENKWVFELYDKLRTRITGIIEPLDQYILQYKQYEKEYKLDPAKVMEPYEDPENWPEVE